MKLRCTFLAQKLYTLAKTRPLKSKLLKLLSSRVKICQIPYVYFETTSQFFFRFFIILRFITHNSSENLQLMHFLLWTKGSHESANFDTFKCSDENLPKCSCHFPKRKSVFLQILNDSSVSRNITPLYIFRSNVVHFAQKGPIKVHILQICYCSDQNSRFLVIFETKNWLFFKFCTSFQYHKT